MAGDQINVLRDELRQLTRLDRPRMGRRRRVFGADEHGYRSSPASVDDGGGKSPCVDLTRPPTFLEWFRAWIDKARSGLLATQDR